MLPVVNNLKHMFQQGSRKTYSDSLHREAGNVYIQNYNHYRLIQTDFLYHRGVGLYFRNLELRIDVVAEAVSQSMDNVFHDSSVECHLHIGVTIVSVRFHNGVRAAEHMAYQSQRKPRGDITHKGYVAGSLTVYMRLHNGHTIIFMERIDIFVVSCFP